MADTEVTRLSTFLRHIEDMRNLSVCKICMRSLYEPFILSCGHTYCYTCLASWFVGAHGRRTKKNCPDCRAKVSAQPSPNYVLRDLVHIFIGRAELLPEDETVQEHQQAKEAEAAQLAADRAGPGLFKGVFLGEPRRQMRWGLGIPDPEDNVVRCPRCHWELEEGECLRCGFHEIYESGSGLESDYDSESMHVASSSEFDAEDDIDHEFDGPMHEDVFDYYNSGMSPITDATDEDEEYGEDDDMDGFIDTEADEDEDEDDTNSESTMTAYNRRWAQSEGYDNESEARSQVSADSTDPVDRYVGYDHSSRNNAWEASDAETNYDEITEASDYEHALPPPPRRRSRGARFIVSDDDDDEEEEDKETEDQDEDEVDEGEDISEHSETENTQDPSESEDSDVRPPQPSVRRRLHLQSQRARRNHHNHQPYGEGSQRRDSSARRQHHHHQQRSHNPQNVSSRRRSGYHQSYNRPGYGRRVELVGS
ncbi:uncharacterized protein Z519_04614 [Cladophialophora bantiana CBS 173.52]|uniref:RING-type domain-containing protein n=1 Tax=Cladophialophora bantiana (strain ATCC 10958 / CBS 173.52 / CDC B-1940 / NIH 8579) TaxID=1442370 RepID=A0A0D2HMP5_CLAB1|nr:uncharacterized protein Z519_04614 [Cladophialophora bantiana CBS 173.52]KIW94638.1 hypothetical protein Z519_04614 [Cladophialophora bantiana CBS 173.52]